jgi:hypothetical protein
MSSERSSELTGRGPTSGRSLEARAAAVIGPALVVPRLVLGALADIRTIAESTRAIPELAAELTAIREHVDSLDDEVARMRQGVDSIGGEVVGVRESTAPLAGRLDAVQASMAPLERLARLGIRRRRRGPQP